MQLTHALVSAGCLAGALAACDGSPADGSDPNAWSPLATPLDGSVAVPGDGGVVVDARCRGEPRHDETVVVSTRGAVSHASGQPCLEGCHEPGGTALTTFAVGGTVFVKQGSRVVAERGFIGVAGVELPVDACGNIYATRDQLKSSVAATPPYTSTFRRMDKTLGGAANPGSCNQSSCHDFSTLLRSGIYL